MINIFGKQWPIQCLERQFNNQKKDTFCVEQIGPQLYYVDGVFQFEKFNHHGMLSGTREYALKLIKTGMRH